MSESRERIAALAAAQVGPCPICEQPCRLDSPGMSRHWIGIICDRCGAVWMRPKEYRHRRENIERKLALESAFSKTRPS